MIVDVAIVMRTEIDRFDKWQEGQHDIRVGRCQRN